MQEAWLYRIWENRWRIAAWLVPCIILTGFANLVVIPLAEHHMATKVKITELQQNIYEAAWFDSTQRSLEGDVKLLKDFKAARESALTLDSSIQTSIDRIRSLAQHTGMEITKTTPILSRAESLRMLKVQVEGYARYTDLVEFFNTLRLHHPDIFLEEMLLRQNGERADSRLETHLVLYEFDRKPGELP